MLDDVRKVPSTARDGPAWNQAHVRIGGTYPLIAVRVGALGEQDSDQGVAVAAYAVALAQALASAGTPPVRLEVEVIWGPTEPTDEGWARLVDVRVGGELQGGDAAGLAALARQVLRERTASGVWRMAGKAAVEVTALLSSHPSADAPPSRGPLLPRRQSACSPESIAPGTAQGAGPSSGLSVPRKTWLRRPSPAMAAAEARRPEPSTRTKPYAAFTVHAAQPRPRVIPEGVHLAFPPFTRRRPRLWRWLPRLRVRWPALDLAWPSLRVALPRPRVALPRLRLPLPEVHFGWPTTRLALPRPRFALSRAGLVLPRARLRLLVASAVVLALSLIVVGMGLWDGGLPSRTIPGPPAVVGVQTTPSLVLESTRTMAATPVVTFTTGEAATSAPVVPEAPGAPAAAPTIGMAQAVAESGALLTNATAALPGNGAGAQSASAAATPPSGTDVNSQPPSTGAGAQAPGGGPTRVPLTPAPAAGAVTRTLLDVSPTVAVLGDLDWPNDPTSSAWFGPDGYHLFARQATQFVAVGVLSGQRLRNTLVTATFHKTNGPPGGGYGIIVRDQGPGPRDGRNQGGRYYIFEVGDHGELGMWRRDQDQWIDILPWTPTAAIHTGNADNVLSVEALGQQFTLVVNGVEVATRTDATLDAGSVGVFVGGDQNHAVLTRLLIQTDE